MATKEVKKHPGGVDCRMVHVQECTVPSFGRRKDGSTPTPSASAAEGPPPSKTYQRVFSNSDFSTKVYKKKQNSVVTHTRMYIKLEVCT
mmetsp:Transcript_23262/g.41960  ORF Transcript_23262/g.41960 Transcript_23262/m.41960 type:complete len:89 (+) Transcript_23262:356-622(+)